YFISRNYHLVVVFDGFDSISFEDSVFDKQNYLILKTLINSFALRGAGDLSRKLGTGANIAFSSIFLLRNSTYANFFQATRSEFQLNDIERFTIAPIQVRSALFNAIHRGIFRLNREYDLRFKTGRSAQRRQIPREDADRLCLAVDRFVG